MSVVTVYDVIAVDEGDTSGNVPQGAQDEVQVRLLGLWIMPQADCQRIRDRGITELLGQQRKTVGRRRVLTISNKNHIRNTHSKSMHITGFQSLVLG